MPADSSSDRREWPASLMAALRFYLVPLPEFSVSLPHSRWVHPTQRGFVKTYGLKIEIRQLQQS